MHNNVYASRKKDQNDLSFGAERIVDNLTTSFIVEDALAVQCTTLS
jgi:pyruvate kinase